MAQHTSSRAGISRREVLKAGVAGVGGLALGLHPLRGGCQEPEEGVMSPAQRPNVLFINIDSIRFDAMSCAGNPMVSTPNLDRLAREGVRFTTAVTPLPMCFPARTSFHTGRSVYSTGCLMGNEKPELWRLGKGSWDQNLASHGYHCEYHGFWHAPEALIDCYRNVVTLPKEWWEPYRAYLREKLGEPPKPQDGQFVAGIPQWPYDPDPPDCNARAARGDQPPPHLAGGATYGVYSLAPEDTYSGFVATRTIDALRRCKDGPFSISAAFLHPHFPREVSAAWASAPTPEQMVPSPSLYDSRTNTPYETTMWQLDSTEIKYIRIIMMRYYQLVQEADSQIGRILDTLDELGLTDRTLVIFNGDHGEMLGDHGLQQKFYPYQASIRVPLLMRLPGRIPGGRIVEHPVNSIDIFATIFDYLGLPCPNQEGLSLRPLIQGIANNHPEYTFSEFGAEVPYHVFVNNDWKYVWTRSAEQPDMLYDLRSDPHELENLLGTNPQRSRYLDQAKAIRTQMLAWMEGIGHPYRDQLAASEIG